MNLRQIDLNLLVALDLLLTERNATRASEKLYLSQSAMSGMLARLRQVFGDELLVRVGRNLELTAFATEMAIPLRQCLLQLEDLLNTSKPFDPAEEIREFRIAATDYAVLLMLGPLVKRLEREAPGISVRFVKLDGNAKERLAAAEIDFSIMPEAIETGLPSTGLFTDSWVCIAWAGHPSVGPTLTVDEFLAQPHMAFDLGDNDHNSLADEHLKHNGVQRTIVASTESFTNAPFLLQGTSMLATVPRRLAERLQQAAGIKLIELPVAVPPLVEQLAWNPRFTASLAHMWMRTLIAEVAATL